MNTPNPIPPPDFDEDFLQTLAKWKEQHKVREDDTILLLLDLFRIHQSHWDEIRHRQMPSLDDFEDDITALQESAKTLQVTADILQERATKELRVVELPTAMVAVFTAALAGFIIGKFI